MGDSYQGTLFRGGRKSVRITGDGHSEHQHQVALISWARNSARDQTDELKRSALLWFHAIPNGAFLGSGRDPDRARATRQALKLITEGLTAGVWDLRLDFVIRDEANSIITPGLIVEMKRPGNKLSAAQFEYGQFMARLGFERLIALNWQEGARGIASYMKLEKHAPIYGP